jgi:hypothetical protein
MWISSKQPSIEEFSGKKNQFDWQAVAHHNFRENLLACFCVWHTNSNCMFLLLSVFISVYCVGNIKLGYSPCFRIITFILLGFVLLIAVSVFIYYFRKDILQEIQNSRLKRQLSVVDKDHD